MKKIVFLIITFLLIFILPLLGSLAKWGGLPPGYGTFPVQEAVQDPGFNALYFALACIVALFIMVFYLFPRVFGFRKTLVAAEVQRSEVQFPFWFWAALPVLVICWFIMWARLSVLSLLEPYTFVPLWWSFICILDGIVYKRNHGVSLLSKKPQIMQLLAVVSCFSWFAFEYLNFFVMENWYYPNKEIFSDFGNIFWFSLSYTTVLPAIIEWYLLMLTIPALRDRYSNGPKLHLNKPTLIVMYILGLGLALAMGYFPFELFWVLWVALVPMLSAAMGLIRMWTPFTPIRQGNWSPMLLIGLATVCNGFFWELWNFGSEWFNEGIPLNPNYWKYSVPYLDKFHIFSQMPLLGYFGYLFFGVNCWVIWLTAAYVFKFNPDFDLVQRRDKAREI
ncbi:hypothetical protein [Paenibacillus dauci]|uniref:hypothetical protein n=1 Tax=Paenibacillus dauci TaxID=1567106 RepID=UPI000619E80D|nr:hypothetical protein [Paenibacillus dauci]